MNILDSRVIQAFKLSSIDSINMYENHISFHVNHKNRDHSTFLKWISTKCGKFESMFKKLFLAFHLSRKHMTNVPQKFFLVSYFIYFYSINITLKEMVFVYRYLMMHLFIYKSIVSKITNQIFIPKIQMKSWLFILSNDEKVEN